MKHILIFTSVVCILFFTACKQSAQPDSADATISAETAQDDAAAQTAEQTPAATENKIVNARFNFGFTIPARYKVKDQSDNGDGYFIETGDAGVDLRIYGEDLTDNTLMAELELKSCEKTESFRFSNGYPGTKCYQSGDIYYYYDTPKVRVVCYAHANARWMERNAMLLDEIAKSIYIPSGK